jgi:hypothetical protein
MTDTAMTDTAMTDTAMTDTAQARRSTPWAAVVVLAVLALVLAGTGGWLIYDRHHRPGLGLNTNESRAMDAARQFVVNVFSYRSGSNFEPDFQRAAAGATGELAKQVQHTKSALQQTLTAGRLSSTKGQVKSAGVEQVSGSSVLVLVVVETFAVDSSGKSTDNGQQRMEVTMTPVKGSWLASALTSVGLT